MILKEKSKFLSKYKNTIILFAAALLLFTAAIIIVVSGRVQADTPDEAPTDGNENSDSTDENSQESTKEDVVSVIINGIELFINSDIPKNELSAEDFTADDNGMLTCNGDGAFYGIDVSSFQGDIDWQTVKASGIDFAIIRLGFRGMSEGQFYTDSNFKKNIDGAIAAGVDVGVYFFSQALTVEEAEDEARYVLDVLDGYELQYPVFFDWEPGTSSESRTFSIKSSVISDFARAFCNIIKNNGFETGIYYNTYQGYLQYDLSAFQDVCLWLAEYDTKPDFYYHFDMWQYSCTGTVDGISTPVDLNICFTLQ